MAVTRVAVTTGAPASAAAFAPTLPTHAAGDRLVLVVTGKAFGATIPTINQSWVLLKSGTTGSVASGADVGSMFWAVYAIDATSSAMTAPTVTPGATAPDTWTWIAASHRPTSGSAWMEALTTSAGYVQSANDTVTTTPVTGTTGTFTNQPTTNDAIFVVGAGPTDLGSALAATPTITATGLSGGTKTTATTQYVENAFGNDCYSIWIGWTGFTGPASAGLAVSYTITSAADFSGAIVAISLREKVLSNGAGNGTISWVGSTTGYNTAPVTATLLAKSTSAANVTANTNVTVTIGATGVATGKWIAVWVAGGGSLPVFTVTDSAGNTYTGQAQTLSGATGAVETGQWFLVKGTTSALTASTSTISVQRNSAGSLMWQAYVLLGALSLDAGGIQYTGAGNGPATALPVSVPGATMTVLNGTMNLYGVTWGNVVAATAGTGYTILDLNTSSGTGNPRGSGVFFRSSAAGETVTPSATIGTGNSYASAALAFANVLLPNSGAANGTITWVGTALGANIGKATGTIAWVGSATGIKPLAHPTLAQIGDSLTYRSGIDASPPSRESTTRAVFEASGATASAASMYWYAVGGKPMSGNDANGNSVFVNITAAQTQLGTPDAWVIGLGTNDVGLSDVNFTAAVNAIMSAIGTSGWVYWMNLAYYSGVNTNALHFNPILASTLSGYSNVTLLDWNTYIHGATYDTADWIFPTDSTHMTVQGWAKRDTYISNQVLGLPNTGSASGAITWVGSARAGNIGRANGTIAWVGTATGTRVPKGDASGAIAWVGVARAGNIGRAVGTITWVGVARAANQGKATGAINWVGAAFGQNIGRATGAISWVGTATGTRVPKGAANGAITWVGVALGKNIGRAVGTISWVGSATGATTFVINNGSATGAITWVGVARAGNIGRSTGAIAWVGSATGTRTPKGAANGTITWVGVARAANTGVANGTIAWVGVARAGNLGKASGAITWVGVATGKKITKAAATGAISWSGVSNGPAQTKSTTRNEVIGLTDSPTATGKSVYIPEVTGITDDQLSYGKAGYFNDIMGIDDSGTNTGTAANVNDVTGISDSGTTKGIAGSITDTTGISDTVRAVGKAVYVADESGITDTVSTSITPGVGPKTVTINDTVGITDPGFTRVTDFSMTADDVMGLSDQAVPTKGASLPKLGSAAGTIAWVGVVTGKRPTKGVASGTMAWVGLSTGKRVTKGAVVGTIVWSGVVYNQHSGSAARTVTWAGISTGITPAVGIHKGIGVGWVDRVGVSTGIRFFHTGKGLGQIAMVGMVTGYALSTNPPDPARVMTIYAEERTLVVDGESRSYQIAPESRVYEIAANLIPIGVST